MSEALLSSAVEPDCIIMAQSDTRGIAIAAGVQPETISPTMMAARIAIRRATWTIILE